MFLSNILKISLIFIIRRNEKLHSGSFFLSDFLMVTSRYNVGDFKTVLKEDLVIEFCKKETKTSVF